MVRIATIVFFDLETTGFPTEENNRTRITELSMVAVRRGHILEQGELLKSSVQPVPVCPRVVNKLTLCLNPRKMISDGASSTTGLTNDLLEHQVHFNEQVFTKLDNFLSILEKPVCLVAHNGMGFDFPILKNHLEKLNVHFSDDILCADSLYAVYDISEGDNERLKDVKEDDVDVPGTSTDIGTRKRKYQAYRPGKKRKIFFENNPEPKLSHTLVDVYKRVVDDREEDGTQLTAHRSENDCIMLLEIAVKMGEEFIEWLDVNHCLFRDIIAMTPGVRLGDEHPSKKHRTEGHQQD